MKVHDFPFCRGRDRHLLKPSNRYTDSSGVDRCLPCKQAADRRYYARNREKVIQKMKDYRRRERDHASAHD